MTADAMFHRDGPRRYVPTAAAVGPWDASFVHGAAVAALLAGRLTPDEGTLARLTVEILAPVPLAPLDITCSDRTGGKRVQRREAELAADGRVVATATSVTVRQAHLDLPLRCLDHDSPFDPAAVPPLREPNHAAADVIGWEAFDSCALIFASLRVPDDRRTHQWISLAIPVVDGSEIQGTELAAVAADYAQNAVARQLPYDTWSFRNAELTLHLARHPVGSWIGMRCESVVQAVGAGFNAADLFDQDGRMGRSAAALVVERR